MSLEFSAVTAAPHDVDATVHLVASGEGALEAAGLDLDRCRRRGFAAKVGQTLFFGGEEGPFVLYAGVGPLDKSGREVLRRVGAHVARELSECSSLAFHLELDGLALGEAHTTRSIVEGALLALDRFDTYRSEPKDPPRLERFIVVGHDLDALGDGITKGTCTADAVIVARALINTPAADCTPSDIAERAVALAGEAGLEVLVYDEHDARRERLGGLLGVGQGSVQPPRLVRLEYTPPKDSDAPVVALVGKGITFDSGGLSLKPANSMTTMKTDMSGAAAVLATLSVCRRLGVRVRVVGFLALAENMPGGRAVKPGDVLKARNGKTIEVLNTDAEGRLVLADALSLASEERPDAIVDLATLTGACVVALGRQLAGRMGNDDALLDALGEAGRQAGEVSWPLPLPLAYRKLIDSEIADMNNQGVPGQAGALVAGLLLAEFVGDVPWAHLDIAGPARAEEDSGYLHKGATGFGVRTLVELLENYEPLGHSAGPSPRGEAVPA